MVFSYVFVLKVAATCADDAMDLVKSLGADLVVDYKKETFKEEVASFGRYFLKNN